MAFPAVLKLLRPRSFFYVMSLRTGVELITLTILINKISGLYGLLAIFTGFQLSPLQISMYIYSIIALLSVVSLAPHIKRQSALQNLALAWFYLVDSVINAVYTAAFGVTWFLVLASHVSSSAESKTASSGQMMDDTAGFTSPQHNVSSVDVITGHAGSLPDTAIVAHPGQVPAGVAAGGALTTTIFESGSIASITIISLLWLIRVYFVLVFFAHARSVLRQHVVNASQNSYDYSASAVEGENPFAPGKDAGRGWSGWVGRQLVSFPRSYWLGGDADEEHWARNVGGKFRKVNEPIRPVERERRHRSGTGPPILQPIELDKIRK